MTTHSAAGVLLRTAARDALVAAGIPEATHEYDNLGATQQREAGTTWARVTVLMSDTVQRAIGANAPERTTGLLVISIFSPLDRGSNPGSLLGDAVRSTLNRTTHSSVVLRTASLASVGRSGATPAWWQHNVSCPFYFE